MCDKALPGQIETSTRVVVLVGSLYLMIVVTTLVLTVASPCTALELLRLSLPLKSSRCLFSR